MAIYEYDCSTCGARLEVMQPMSALPLQRCGEHCAAPAAGPKKVRRGEGVVARRFSAVNVGRGGGDAGGGGDWGGGGADPSCGSCGRVGPDVCN